MIEAAERGGRIRAADVKGAVNWFPSRHGCAPQHFLGGHREISKFEALERNIQILCHRKAGWGKEQNLNSFWKTFLYGKCQYL